MKNVSNVVAELQRLANPKKQTLSPTSCEITLMNVTTDYRQARSMLSKVQETLDALYDQMSVYAVEDDNLRHKIEKTRSIVRKAVRELPYL